VGNDTIFVRNGFAEDHIDGGSGTDSAQIDNVDDDDPSAFLSIETLLP
jgi:hypothetical protein